MLIFSEIFTTLKQITFIGVLNEVKLKKRLETKYICSVFHLTSDFIQIILSIVTGDQQ